MKLMEIKYAIKDTRTKSEYKYLNRYELNVSIADAILFDEYCDAESFLESISPQYKSMAWAEIQTIRIDTTYKIL